MKALIGCFLLFSVGSAPLASPVDLNLTARSVLSDSDLAGRVGTGCDEAAGVMTSLAFAAGYTNALVPALSAGFLAGAIVLGAGIVIWC